VWIFQGDQDRAVPTSQAHTLAGTLASSHLRLFPDAGHGLILGHWRDILSDLQIQHHGLEARIDTMTNDLEG